MMRTEQVVLPEPGRTLLRRTYPILMRRFGADSAKAGFIIGGGTMLAARWGHRASKDLDIKVNSSEGYRVVSRMYEEPMLEASLDREMHGAGARAKKRSSQLELMYLFGDEYDKDPPRIDLVELAPKLRGQMVRTESEGMRFWSATNEEILAGKWIDRRDDSPVRDIFDFAVAGVRDGHALQRALASAGDARDLDAMVEHLASAQERYSAEGKATIAGVPPQIEYMRDDPARFCAWAIGRWALTAVEITHDGSEWTVTTRCRAENEGAERGRYEELEAAVESAARLGGIRNEEVDETIAEARRAGGVVRRCPGSQLREATGPSMEVDARGSVMMRDFGRAPTVASTIEQAVEIAIERGWERRERAETAIAEMRELQREVVEKERSMKLTLE